MSKAILVYFRERIDYSDQIFRKLETICENLQPDNFQANAPQLWKNTSLPESKCINQISKYLKTIKN